jgi:uncharacterized membrane protein YvlD (DUF360 family)
MLQLTVLQFITAWAVLTLACWASIKLLPGVNIPDAKDALVIAAVLGAISELLGYLVLLMFGVDNLMLTGIEIFVIRSIVIALLFTVLAERMKPRLAFQSSLSALGCAVLMSGLGTTLQYLM